MTLEWSIEVKKKKACKVLVTGGFSEIMYIKVARDPWP